MNELTETQKLILSILSSSLFNSELILPDEVNWRALKKESEAQAVYLLVSSVLNPDLIPDEIKAEWKHDIKEQTAASVFLEHQNMLLHSLLSENNIPYTTLKGCASASYYPEPYLRAVGDVDFLVDKKDFDRADRLLQNNGYVLKEKEHLCHWVYEKDEINFEMHFEPSGVPDGEAGELVREYLKDCIEKSEIYDHNGTIMVPSRFHHGLIILLHTVHHLTGEGVGLRQLCDWAVFADSLDDSEFCELFEDKLKAIGLWHFTRILTKLCTEYLGCPAKKWAEKADNELLDALIKDVFAGGNFGKKDIERSNEAYIISSRGKSGVGEMSNFKQLLKSVNQAVKVHFPLAQKNKAFLPLGWIYVVPRQLFYIATGRRKKLHLKKMIKGANERKEIYKELKIFE